MKPTHLEDLRKPHPDQKRIDAETVALLLATKQKAVGLRSKAKAQCQPEATRSKREGLS